VGGREIMAAPFFAVLDFDALLRRELVPPFKPDVENETDTTYVPASVLRTEARDSAVEPTPKGHVSADFGAFTYTGEKDH
jgi:hypothetical protein